MRLKKIDIYRLKIPLSTPFKHALADHRFSDNLIVKLLTKNGVIGYGEGVPRNFVTGERLTESITFLKQDLWPHLKPVAFENFSDIKNVIAKILLPEKTDQAPAVCCAVELAILDAAGKNWKRPVSEQFGPGRNSLRYSGVLPMVDKPGFEKLIQLVKEFGVREIKLKVGDADDLDRLLLARRTLGPDVDIRVDANGAWGPEEAVSHIHTMAASGISAIEQPVAKNDLKGLQHVVENVRIPVILDESMCGVADAEKLAPFGDRVMFNIRLSKCGGMVAADNLYTFAQAHGIKCQLGCQVGETSILAAAGQQFAANHQLQYLEGAYAAFLLDEDIANVPVTFGKLGLATPSTSPGLGVDVNDRSLERLAVDHWVLD